MSWGALAAVVLLLSLPGLGALLAVFRPGKLDLATQVAAVFGLGYGVTGTVALVLVAGNLLEPAFFFAALAAVTAVLWVIAARRSSLRSWLQQAARDFRADPVALGVGFSVVVAIAFVRSTISPLLSFYATSPFRYWADGVEIAAAGRIPDLSIHWGSAYPPTISKSFFNSFNAGLSFVFPDEPLVALGSLVWVVSVGLAVALWSLGRELSLRLTAPLLPLVLLASSIFFDFEMTRDLKALKAELLGRLVALAALALAIGALRERRRGIELFTPGLLFGAAAATHFASIVVFGAMLTLYALTLLLRDRTPKDILVPVAAIVATGAVAGAGAILLARGHIGFQGLTGRESYHALQRGFDPTAKFAFDRSAPLGGVPGPWYAPPSQLAGGYLAEAFGIPPSERPPAALPVLGAALLSVAAVLALVGLVRFPYDLKPVVFVAVGTGVILLGLALAFSYRFEMFVPATTGARRLEDYSPLLVLLLALVVLELALGVLRRLRPIVPGIVAAALAVVLGALLLPRVPPSAQRVEAAERTVAALGWLESNTPCEARIVANRATEGIFQAMTGRVGVLEGMAPYFRPRVLEQVLALNDEAQAFLADPLRNARFLTKRDVDFVVLVDAIPFENSRVIRSAPPSQFERVPALQLAYSAPGIDIFRASPRRDERELIDRTDVSPSQCR